MASRPRMWATVLDEAACAMSATCVFTSGPGSAAVECGELSIATITFGCVHEHVDPVRACAGCAADVQRAAGLLICAECEDCSDPHGDCLQEVRITWDDGSPVTIVQEASGGS